MDASGRTSQRSVIIILPLTHKPLSQIDHRISHGILRVLYRNLGQKVNQVEIRAHDRDVGRGTHRGWILLFRGSRGDLHRDCHGGCKFRSTGCYGKWTSSAQSLFERCEHSSFSSTRYVGGQSGGCDFLCCVWNYVWKGGAARKIFYSTCVFHSETSSITTTQSHMTGTHRKYDRLENFTSTASSPTFG